MDKALSLAVVTQVANEDNHDLDSTGLCLLSLDGGGVRGLSSLYILKGLMTRLNDERHAAGLPQVKPCEIFDLIGGTSTGGLIAIMLGRLEMDVDECIAAFRETMKAVFEKKRNPFPISLMGNVKAKFSSKTLEAAIKRVIRDRHGIREDDLLYDQSADRDATRKCRVFVCAKSQETNQIARLRSYRLPGGFDDNPRIWEAALATSAAPSFLDPVKIGVRKYVDGAIGANNPVSQVEDEAANIWCEDTRELKPILKCFISIGTGHADIVATKDKSLKALAETIVKVATETRKTNEEFSGRWRAHLDTRFFRFNVDTIQDVALEEYDQEAIIDARTRRYLDDHSLQRKVIVCVQNLRQKRYKPNQHFALERARAEELKEKKARDGRRPIELGQRQSTTTATEISELIDRGNVKLRRAADYPIKEDLFKAQDDFTGALRGMTAQNPVPKPKEFARVYQKLSITFLRLSHLPIFTETERMAYVREAEKQGALGLDHAMRSQNDGRVAQMRFHMACVHAREVCLLMEEAGTEPRAADPLRAKREGALGAVSIALSELEGFDGMDMAGYEKMARQYSRALLP